MTNSSTNYYYRWSWNRMHYYFPKNNCMSMLLYSWINNSICRNCTHSSQNITFTVHTYSKIHFLSTYTLSHTRRDRHAALKQMLKVQIICPVEEVNHDKRQGEDDSRVVVYVVWVLHVTAVYGAEDFAESDQNSDAPVGGLRRRRLRFRLTTWGAGWAYSMFCGGGSWGRTCSRLLASLGSVSVTGDGGDDAVHFIIKVMHVVSVL